MATSFVSPLAAAVAAMRRPAAAGLLLLALSACGGGGGSGSAAPPAIAPPEGLSAAPTLSSQGSLTLEQYDRDANAAAAVSRTTRHTLIPEGATP